MEWATNWPTQTERDSWLTKLQNACGAWFSRPLAARISGSIFWVRSWVLYYVVVT